MARAPCANHMMRCCSRTPVFWDTTGTVCKDYSRMNIRKKGKDGPYNLVLLTFLKVVVDDLIPCLLHENVPKFDFYATLVEILGPRGWHFIHFDNVEPMDIDVHMARPRRMDFAYRPGSVSMLGDPRVTYGKLCMVVKKLSALFEIFIPSQPPVGGPTPRHVHLGITTQPARPPSRQPRYHHPSRHDQPPVGRRNPFSVPTQASARPLPGATTSWHGRPPLGTIAQASTRPALGTTTPRHDRQLSRMRPHPLGTTAHDSVRPPYMVEKCILMVILKMASGIR
jgi:hypothetical protein